MMKCVCVPSLVVVALSFLSLGSSAGFSAFASVCENYKCNSAQVNRAPAVVGEAVEDPIASDLSEPLEYAPLELEAVSPLPEREEISQAPPLNESNEYMPDIERIEQEQVLSVDPEIRY